MAVTVRVGSALASLLDGERETQADGGTVGEVLDHLGIRERLCDASGELRRHFNVHINEGEDIRLLQGLDSPVQTGDVVTVLSAIAGGAEAARKVWLTFPKNLVDRPLVWEVGQKFQVVTNIRQASVTSEIGIVGLEVSGEEDEVEKAIQWLAAQGVSVEPIERDVVE
ncbi:MAG: NIL domain-containing protein [Armatimonadota bacterium]